MSDAINRIPPGFTPIKVKRRGEGHGRDKKQDHEEGQEPQEEENPHSAGHTAPSNSRSTFRPAPEAGSAKPQEPSPEDLKKILGGKHES